MRLLVYQQTEVHSSTAIADHGRALALEFVTTISIDEDDYAPFGGTDGQANRYINAVADALRAHQPPLRQATYTIAPEYSLVDLHVKPQPKIIGGVLGGCALSTRPDGELVADIPF